MKTKITFLLIMILSALIICCDQNTKAIKKMYSSEDLEKAGLAAGALLLGDTQPEQVFMAEATPASCVPSSRVRI